MPHPHPDREHIMRSYRRFIIGKRREFTGKWGHRAHRSMIHYMDIVHEYLEAKRDVLASRDSTPPAGRVARSRT